MMRKLLVATDGKAASRRAEDLALDLTRSYAGELYAVSVIHVESEEERGDQMAEAMEHLTRLRERARASGLAVEVAVLRGPPAETIVKAALERNVDAIVVGTASKTGLTHALLGSVAERIVRTADRTVIVAK